MISPNSRYIGQQLSEIRDRKGKNAFLESIMSDPTATILNEMNGHRTILFQGNKGPKTGTWNQTKLMAFELNEAGFDVAFLPELLNETCADCLLNFGKIYKIVDFKYCVTRKANTLVMDLEHGFQQANTIVLKLSNMDTGAFKKAIEYLLRNGLPFGDVILLNKYGKILQVSKRDFHTSIYRKRIKGFL